MRRFDSVARKVCRPPGGHNFARLNVLGDEERTTERISSFALSIPAFNYLPSISQIQTLVQLGLSVETAVNAVLSSGAPAGRVENERFVRAFFAFDELRGYSRARFVDSYVGQYRISRDVNVPTKPTFTVLEKGHQVPIIVVGWKHLDLEHDQIRLWFSLLESGLFSYADYRRSPAEVVFFPEQPSEPEPIRAPFVIKRGDYQLLSEAEMRNQAELYVRAQAAAMPIAEARWLERERRREERERARPSKPAGDQPQDDLFRPH